MRHRSHTSQIGSGVKICYNTVLQLVEQDDCSKLNSIIHSRNNKIPLFSDLSGGPGGITATCLQAGHLPCLSAVQLASGFELSTSLVQWIKMQGKSENNYLIGVN
jgi:hypothetical protein